MVEMRCQKCNKLLGKVEGKAEIKCPRCSTINVREDVNRTEERTSFKNANQMFREEL